MSVIRVDAYNYNGLYLILYYARSVDLFLLRVYKDCLHAGKTHAHTRMYEPYYLREINPAGKQHLHGIQTLQRLISPVGYGYVFNDTICMYVLRG